MKSPNFDEKVKSLFEDDLELPPELVWEEMDFSAAFDKQKRKKRFIFFWFGVFVFLVASMFFFQNQFTPSHEITTENHKKNLSPEINNHNSISLNNSKKPIPKNNSLSFNNVSSQKIISNRKVPPTLQNNSLKSPTLSPSIPSSIDKKDKSIENLFNPINSAELIKNNTFTIKNNKTFSKTKRPSKLISLKKYLTDQQLDSINISPAFQIKTINPKFSITFFGGVNQFSNKFSGLGDFTEKLEKSESSKIGFYGKLLFRKRITPYFRMGSGIQMEVFHTFFEASDILPTKIQNTFTQVVITDQTRFVKHNNYYQSLSIPLTLELIINSKNKWNFGLGIEANLGIWSKATGRSFNDLGEIVYFSEANLFQSTNNFNLAIGGNSSIEYNLSSKASLIFNLGYTRQLKNMSGQDRMVVNRPTNIYSGLGIQYNF